MTYTFPAGTNNGKISSQYDALSGETVTYAYDSLNRLLSASATGWSDTYGYDGFGNLVSKTPTGGAPQLSQAVDPATNRAIITNVQYDANGNPSAYNNTQLLWDSENHLLSAVGLTDYLYDSQGKRIWKGSFSGGSLVGQEVYFYGVDGQKLGTYTLYLNYGTGQPLYLADPNASLAVFFGAKRVAVNGAPFVPDRLGSNTAAKYFPYGEDRGTPIANDQVKFATYTRDQATALDYADQRYYSSQFARFMTPDPYEAGSGPGDPRNPQTWNHYAYAISDPINGNDPTGQDCNLVSDGSGNFVLNCTFPIPGSAGGPPPGGGGGGGGGGPSGPDTPSLEMPPDLVTAQSSNVTNFELKDAVKRVQDALSHSDCVHKVFGTAPNLGSGFFGTGPTPTPSDVFKSIAQNGAYGQIIFGNPKNPVANAETTAAWWSARLILDSGQVVYTYNTIVINNTTDPRFAHSNMWNFSTATDEALTLLHEFGHILENMGWTGGLFINNDVNPIINNMNDIFLKTNCGSYLH